MKFGHEFGSQMVPEWQQAYMDYNNLNLMLTEIVSFKRPNDTPSAVPAGASLNRKASLYRAFSGLTCRYNNMMGSPKKEDEDQVILVNTVQPEGLEGQYETTFLMPSEQGGEYEMMFFRRLDEEFNKVVKFYRGKVEEVLKEAEELNKQMDALIALRVKVKNSSSSAAVAPMHVDDDDHAALSSSPLVAPIDTGTSARACMDVIQEVATSREGCFGDEEMGVNEVKANNHGTVGKANSNINGSRPAPSEVLKNVKINITRETPMSTLKGILMDAKYKDLTFTRKELRKVHDRMKYAFIEFYQKLQLLKSYSFLNVLAFSKIMKKYDKITSRRASRAYLTMVDNSYLGSSDEVTRLMERLEASFIKHFSNANRKKGINTLRPKARRETHKITFFLGFLSGCAVALIVAIVLLIHARNIIKSEGRGRYMENMFPLYSLFGFIVLHMFMFSANIYFWRRYRVNYPFIFGFKPGTALGYREVFLLSAGLAVLALASVISSLNMDMDSHTRGFKLLTELVPLGLVVVILLIILCPFNIIYRSNRFFLIQCVLRCICAPLYKVNFPDFFLADQLTSQVQAIRSLEFYICYYGWGDFRRRTNKCHQSSIFNTFNFIVAVIPYWFRFLQCLRRLFEEKDAVQGYNGARYLLTIVAVVTRTAYDLKRGVRWKILAGVSSSIAAIASTYWDLVKDWGLLQPNSKNRWLRDKLLVPHKSVYFTAMVLNVVLRFAWVQSVLEFREIGFLHRTAVTAIVACLEVIRRGMWNFFRLENEHLNNVGNYRAFKSVPLPFSYEEDEYKDE